LQSWENFGHNLDSNYEQTTRCFQEKRSRTVIGVEEKNVVLFNNEEDILCRWREYFIDFSPAATLIPKDTQEVHCEEENIITEIEVFLAVKALT